MAKKRKQRGVMDILIDSVNYLSRGVLGNLFSQLAEAPEKIMDDIDERILKIENRIIKKLSFLLVTGFGGIFLIFALLFFLKERFGFGNAAAFFFIGITIFVAGLLLKIWELER